MPAAGAVRAVVSGSPSEEEEDAFGAERVAPDGALEVDAPAPALAGSGLVRADLEPADPAPTPGAPATAGSTFCAVATIRCGRAFSSEEAATPLRERSSSDL